ncbi:hypothetical protein [Methanospirillum sp.]|uniref:hypothetical protein n=1 Tax=Methanospirillum sp. TaxID=45200 RepID=UPI0035A0B635
MKSLSIAGIITLAIISVIFFPVHAEIQVNSAYYIGEEIIISGDTNFNTDNSVLIEIWPISFGPKSKYDLFMEGGGSVAVPVLKMENSNYHWIATFDSTDWMPDTYMIRAEIIGKGYIETTTFDLVEKKAEIPAALIPTLVPSEISQTQKETTISPVETEEVQVEKTSEPIPLPTQKSSLNGMIILISLCLLVILLSVYQNRQ